MFRRWYNVLNTPPAPGEFKPWQIMGIGAIVAVSIFFFLHGLIRILVLWQS